ncbi:MAG TPA: hypothetical protein VGL94_18650 [Ktedonobacteraceae bacterium]
MGRDQLSGSRDRFITEREPLLSGRGESTIEPTTEPTTQLTTAQIIATSFCEYITRCFCSGRITSDTPSHPAPLTIVEQQPEPTESPSTDRPKVNLSPVDSRPTPAGASSIDSSGESQTAERSHSQGVDLENRQGDAPLTTTSTEIQPNLLGDEKNSYLVRHKDGEIYSWPIEDGDPSLSYAFASISETPRLYFTNNRLDSRYQDEARYWPIHRSDQIRDTDLFSLPPHQEVLQIRQLLSLVKEVTERDVWLENFFQSRREYFAELQGSADWEELTTCREQLKASHDDAQQCLASEEPSSANLGEQHNKLIQSQRAMENAFLPFKLRDAIMSTEGRHTWVQDFLNSHQAFLTELNGSSSGAEVCGQVYEKLRQLNDTINAARTKLASEARTPENLLEECEKLDKSLASLDEAMLPLRLQFAEMGCVRGRELLNRHQAFSYNGGEVHSQIREKLEQLEVYVDAAKKRLITETRTHENLLHEHSSLNMSLDALDDAVLSVLEVSIKNAKKRRAISQDFLDCHRVLLTELEKFDNEREVCNQIHESLSQLKAHIKAAKKSLTSEIRTHKNLLEECERLDKSSASLDEAMLPLKLRVAIASMEGLRPWARNLLDSHQAFFTGLKASSSEAEVCRQVHEKLKQFNDAIDEAKTRFTSKTKISNDLLKAHKKLDESWALLDEAMLPFRLRDVVKTGQEQYILASTLKKESSDLIANPQHFQANLRQLIDNIVIAEQYFVDMKAESQELHTIIDKLFSNQENIRRTLPPPPIALQAALERYAQDKILQIKEKSNDWIENRITSIQRKMQLLGPIQRVLPILATTTLKPIRRGLSDPLVQRSVACLGDATRILDNASTFLLGEHIYGSAEECFLDKGEKVRATLSTIEQDLSGLQGQLEQTFTDENLSSLQEQLNHILEGAETYLPSKLSDQTSRTIEALNNVRQYWQSHKEEIARQFPRDQHNHIKFTLNAIGYKYSKESADLSILGQVTTGSNDSHAQITGSIKLSPQAKETVSWIIMDPRIRTGKRPEIRYTKA